MHALFWVMNKYYFFATYYDAYFTDAKTDIRRGLNSLPKVQQASENEEFEPRLSSLGVSLIIVLF